MTMTSSDRDLPTLVGQIERERVRPGMEQIDKLGEVAVEAPRVQAMQEIQVAAAGDDFDDHDFPHRPAREPRRPRVQPNNDVAAPPPPSFRPRQTPGGNNPRYENLSDFSSNNYTRSTPGGGQPSPRSSPPQQPRPTAAPRSTPPQPATPRSSMSGSNHSSYRNQTGPNSASAGNSGIYVNVDASGAVISDGGPTSRSSSSSSSSSPNRGGGSDSGDRRRNIQDGSSIRSSNESLDELNYVEEDELALLDPSRYDLVQNEETGESILVDLHVSDRFTVLPRNWRTLPDTYYIADEDVDFAAVQVYTDGRNKRRYVFDPRTARRYFLVPIRCVKKLAPEGARPVVTEDARNVISVVHSDSKENEIEFHYVQESELNGLDLTSFNVYQDEENEEVILVDPGYPNRFWVVLRDDWRTADDLPYLAEEDAAAAAMDVYTESSTRRKFIIDEQLGERYFIVPKFRENIRNYVTVSNVPLLSKAANNNAGKKVGFADQQQQARRTQSQDDAMIVKRLGSEEIRVMENEPASSRLRKIAANSPERFKNCGHIFAGDQNRVVIKQPGKPGHLIKPANNNNANGNKPIPRGPTPEASQRPIVGWTSSPPPPASKTPAKSASPAPRSSSTSSSGGGGGGKKPSKPNTDPNFLKARQEAARRAFFAQKLPYVGELWLHQQLIEQINNKKKLDNLKEAYLAKKSLDYEDDPNRYLDENGRVRSFRDLTDLNDPTLNADKDGLDPNRLLDVQMYGYEKYNKNRRKVFGEKEENYGSKDSRTKMPNNKSFGGFENNYPFVRGVLTEDFVEDREYAPVQLNSQYRALFPFTKLNLRQQFLLTPSYLRHTWDDVVHKREGLVPRIILIDDDERIITKNRDCNVYIQYYYEHDGVLGADPAYQLMVPDRGPTKPARPLKISPAKLSKKLEMLNAKAGVKKPQLALREAPVYVYHPNGSAYYENLAQYLANKHPQLSPKTARKILQFSDLKEFEDYLAAKCTRDEAQRIADSSGEALINVDAIKGDLVKALSDDATYFDTAGCEYDPLRPHGREEGISEETRDIEVNGKIIKSTFIGLGNDGQVKRVKSNELPQNITSIVRDAMHAENSRKSATSISN